MGKDKARRFAENETFALLIQPTFEEIYYKEEGHKEGYCKDYRLKGHWHEEFFHNDNPIVLELGCGRGEYTIAMARRNPNINYIGVDIKGARLWRGAKTATEEHLGNVGFIRTRIEFIESFFGDSEVAGIWLTFSDPQIKSENRRLTNEVFLNRYRKFLAHGAEINLKTDSQFLHEYTLEVIANDPHLTLIEANNDIYGTGRVVPGDILEVKTHYEEYFLKQGLPITYLKFKVE